jgi:hypothetical protein
MARALPSSWKLLPSFMILGAQKAGTTSMFAFLSSHPQVLRPWFKEMDFFNRRRMFSAAREYSLADYRALFPLTVRAIVRNRSLRKRVITGEASQYLSFDEAPRRIKSTVPGANFIVMLRNPVERAYSHYVMRVRYGFEKASFADAWAREDLAKKMEAGSSYKIRSLYAMQLRWWFAEFPRDQFLILESGEMKRDPRRAYDEVCDFLGVGRWRPDAGIQRNVGSYQPLDPKTRQMAQAFFRPHNLELYELLGRDFGWDR